MQIRFLAGLVGVLLAFSVLPAQAQWKSYVNKEVGFSFLMPGVLSSNKGTFKTPAGDKPSTVYSATDDNIVYQVSVAEIGGQDGIQAIRTRRLATANSFPPDAM